MPVLLYHVPNDYIALYRALLTIEFYKKRTEGYNGLFGAGEDEVFMQILSV